MDKEGSPFRQSDFSDMGVELPPVAGAETVPMQRSLVDEGREFKLDSPEEGTKLDWPPVPDRLNARIATQSEYPPIPGHVGELVEAVRKSSGCSRPIAALGVLGSLSALAAGDWTVQTLAHDPKPPIFHLLGISESTWRKTTAAGRIWQPHFEADREVESAWREASALMMDLPSGRWPDSMMPRRASPRLTRGALSVAEVKRFLKHGRPSQAQVCDGTAALVKASFAQASLPSALEFYCTTFDGSELSYEVKGNSTEPGAIMEYRHQLVAVGSSSDLMAVICHPAASSGFSGRCLVAKDDHRPSKPKPRWDVHLPEAENRSGRLAGAPHPVTARLSGTAVSPRLCGWPVRQGICRPSPAPPPCFPSTDCRWPPLSPNPRSPHPR